MGRPTVVPSRVMNLDGASDEAIAGTNAADGGHVEECTGERVG